MALSLRLQSGPQLKAVIPQLAELRIRVFREWPYLYDGTPEYEARHLQTQLDCPDGLIVTLHDDNTIVGASSALPLNAENPEFQRPFLERNWNTARVFYLAESVLLPPYRQQGWGVKFFEAREAHARKFGCDVTTFCAVQRPANHPAKPENAVSLEGFWRKRGYTLTDLETTYPWLDLGESLETSKVMRFWLKLI